MSDAQVEVSPGASDAPKEQSIVIMSDAQVEVSPGASDASKEQSTASRDNNYLFNFNSLRLVDKPDSRMNSSSICKNLKGCEGYLQRLPLKPPNVDHKLPHTIVDMINILTDPSAAVLFERERDDTDVGRSEGYPSYVFHYDDSPLMKIKLMEAKQRQCKRKAPGRLGHVVRPGCLSFYENSGKTYAVGEGRWWLASSTKANWMKDHVNISLDNDSITAGNVQILRVLHGEVGLVREQSTEVLLDVGTHVFNSGTVTFVGKIIFSDKISFNHGRYHYLSVARGYFGLVWVQVVINGLKTLVPRLLDQGVHCTESHVFKYDGYVKCSDEYIEHGSIHRITVPTGKVAKVFQESKPRLLGEGVHSIDSTDFRFHGLECVINNPCIVHGTITILRVTSGKVALVWIDNEPVFLSDQGLYEFDSPDFSFVEFRDAEERLIQLGSKKFINIRTGQVGVTYDEGKLRILDNGSHEINSSTHTFKQFLSIQQRCVGLTKSNASDRTSRNEMERKKSSKFELDDDYLSTGESDLTVCETKDCIKVGLRADALYNINDPMKCIKQIDIEMIEDFVSRSAVVMLMNTIRLFALNEITKSNQVSSGHTKEIADVESLAHQRDPSNSHNPPSAPMTTLFEKAPNEFVSKLRDDFRMQYGVDITNIRIDSFKVMDPATIQIKNDMAKLKGESMISFQKERNAAQVQKIRAKADAAALKISADAENRRKIDAARAEAKATRNRAGAEAHAILLKAKAEAESIRLKAAAEAERVEKNTNTDLEKQEALLKIYSKIVIDSIKGVEKKLYLDPTINWKSSFALGSLHNVNEDLHLRSQVGIDASDAGGENGSAEGHEVDRGHSPELSCEEKGSPGNGQEECGSGAVTDTDTAISVVQFIKK